MLGAVGGPAAVIGAAMCLAAFLREDRSLLIVGTCYVLPGLVLLLVRQIFVYLRRSSQTAASPPESSQDGIALVAVLLVLALLSGLVAHSLVYASLALRSAEAESGRARARLAAADAMWHGLRKLVGSGVRTPAPVLLQDPSGVEARVRISAESDQSRGAARDFSLRATAAAPNAAAQIYCRARREASGTVRVLRWVEE